MWERERGWKSTRERERGRERITRSLLPLVEVITNLRGYISKASREYRPWLFSFLILCPCISLDNLSGKPQSRCIAAGPPGQQLGCRAGWRRVGSGSGRLYGNIQHAISSSHVWNFENTDVGCIEKNSLNKVNFAVR